MIASYCLILVAGLVAGCLSGIIGTGASIIMLPVLVPVFGAVHAVPIMAIAGLMGNLGRVVVWHRDVDWRAVVAYCITSVPAAALGAMTLVTLPEGLADALLGGFLVLLVPARHVLERRRIRVRLRHLSMVGAVVGYLTGIFLSTGPLSVPAFLSYGLSGGGFISTEAAASMITQIGKIASFGELGVLSGEVVVQGLLVGFSLMGGTFLSKRFVLKLGSRSFRRIMDAVTLLAGAWLLFLAALHI